MKKKTMKALVLNRETVRTLDLASARGGVEVIPIDYNLTQDCPLVPREPVDQNDRYRIPSIFR